MGKSEEGTAHIRTFHSENIINESNASYSRIKEINIVERIITLEDDSKWDIGFWYKDVILDWQEGDRLTISRSFGWNEWCLHNLEKNSSAWGGILYNWYFPTVENSDYIIEATCDDFGFHNKVTLKSGFQFSFGSLCWTSERFKKGDAVFVYQIGESYIMMKLNGK